MTSNNDLGAQGRNQGRNGGGAASASAGELRLGPAAAEYERVRRGDGLGQVPRAVRRAAVKELLALMVSAAPGSSVELRVPPDGAVQLFAGPDHRRGQPSATIELDPDTLIGLCSRRLSWEQERGAGRVQASGERADLGPLLQRFAVGGDSRE